MDQMPIDAIFENGLFRPLSQAPLPVREGERVRLRIEETPKPSSLEQACHVLDGLSSLEISEIERISHIRDDFFGSRTTG